MPSDPPTTPRAAGRLIIVTGATAAGKTTVGHAIAARLPRAVHVDGDTIQGFVVSGAIGMDEPAPDGALEQLLLRYDGALAVAAVYTAAGFDAVVTDNVFETDLVDMTRKALATGSAVHVVVLDPALDTIRARYEQRPGGGYTDTITPELLIGWVDRTPRLGLRIDTGGQSPTESADEILARLDEAAITRIDRRCG